MEIERLVYRLRRMAMTFEFAAPLLANGDLERYREFYARALRELDTYQDEQSSASL